MDYHSKIRTHKETRFKKGNGCRVDNLPDSFNEEELLDAEIGSYCPKSMLIIPFGIYASSLTFDLANVSEELFRDVVNFDGIMVPFTLGNYVKKFQLIKIRVHLVTRLKNICNTISYTVLDSVNDDFKFEDNTKSKKIRENNMIISATNVIVNEWQEWNKRKQIVKPYNTTSTVRSFLF